MNSNLKSIVGVVIALAILETSQASKVRAEMPEGDAWNVGSVFAAGTQCEMKGYMAQGQTTPPNGSLYAASSGH